MQDIYFSIDFGPAQIDAVLSNAFNDVRPFVSKDGLEVFFDSNRPGTLGLQDIWTARRENTSEAWSTPTHLDAPINSPAMEARPTLSRDGSILLFGSSRAGGDGLSDIYVTTREKLN